MAGMNDEVVIVILDEEIQGRKRVNNEEGSKAAEWPIRVGRNLGITWFAQKITKRLPKTASPLQAGITWFAPNILKRYSETQGGPRGAASETNALGNPSSTFSLERSSFSNVPNLGNKNSRQRQQKNDLDLGNPMFRTGTAETPSSLQAGAGCDGEKRKELAVSDEVNRLRELLADGRKQLSENVNRLRGLLADGPKKLSEKDMDDVIQYVKVDGIVSVVLKSGQSEDYNMIGNNNRVDPYEPSAVEVVGLVTRVLRRIEKVEEADVRVLYRNFPYREFALLLLTAVDSYSKRCFGGEPLIKAKERDVIPYLCSVLPWKLFAHVLSCKAQLPLLKPTIKEVADRKAEEAKRKAEEAKRKAEEEAKEECSPYLKKIAESCGICLGKGRHHEFICSFKKCIPIGATVGPDYWALCRCCHAKLTNPVTMCYCGSEEGGYSFWLPADLLQRRREEKEAGGKLISQVAQLHS